MAQRVEAEKWIGTKVTAWSAYRGTYGGTLLRLKPDSRPWRGIIRVEWPCELPSGRAHFLREGAELEVGGVNIKPYDAEPPTYTDAVNALFAHQEAFLDQWEQRCNSATEGRIRGDMWVIELNRKTLARLRQEIANANTGNNHAA